MVYRVCKAFEVESGHMLSKHPGRCRYPHGHSRRVEVVVASLELDENEMVCDFSALKVALAQCLDRLDHAMAVNSEDPALEKLREFDERLVVFQGKDPTTEILAKYIYDSLADQVARHEPLRDERAGGGGREYRLPRNLIVERVRVGETSSSWAEYGRE